MAVPRDQIVDEIRTLSADLGRPPTAQEWKAHFHHGDSRCRPYGGFAVLRDEAAAPGFEVDDLPEDVPDVESLLARRADEYARVQQYEDAHKLVTVRIKIDGPIAICHHGDPHIDDPGTNIQLLQHNLDLVEATDGMWNANVGDNRNGWVGRLAHLYSEQTTTAKEGVRLVEWLLGNYTWLYLVLGNHDLWHGAEDPSRWLMTHRPTVTAPSQVRIALQFPNKREVRINARHDYKGWSMWNPAHGPGKAAQMGWRDHILTCGHKHVSAMAGPFKCPMTGVLSYALRVAGYKTLDSYARVEGFPDQNFSPCVVTIIDPDATEETGLVTVLWDLEMAADFLGWLRKKRVA